MSWAKTFTIKPNTDIRRGELIENALSEAPVANAPDRQLWAAREAASRMALAVDVPDGFSIQITLSGHWQGGAPNSMPDSLSVNLQVVP